LREVVPRRRDDVQDRVVRQTGALYGLGEGRQAIEIEHTYTVLVQFFDVAGAQSKPADG
jgi:hypothetical protein